MPSQSLHKPQSSFTHLRAKYVVLLRLLSCFVLVAAATLFCGISDHALYLWVANGVLLAYLLLAPRKLWPAYLVAALLGHLAVSPWMHSQWSVNLFFAPHDVIEATLAALLLRRRDSDLPEFTNSFYLLRFAACALLAVPLSVSLVTSLIYSMWQHVPFLHNFAAWFLAESLGVLVATPAFVAVLRPRPREANPEQKDWFLLALVLTVCALLLGLPSFIGPSFLFPLLVFVLLRFGLGWASFATLASTAISAWYTARGIGPFALAINPVSPGLRLQGFTVSVMIVLYSVSVVVENLRTTERSLKQIAVLHALVAENSRDVILLLDFEGNGNFISAPERFWGGWSRDEILATGTFELFHPEDQKSLKTVLEDLRHQKEGTLVELRIRRKDSTYAWLEASLRTVRDPITEMPTGVLASIREISERKETEKQLEDAFHAAEALSVTDPLTGLANRRRFDQGLGAEWRRALREQNPLSLLLIDADHFKDYNDNYGHPSGDACLKQIADAVRCGATRASDLAARIGGEEFVVLLPNTSGDGARNLANHICEVLRSRAITHSQSPHGIVTVSIGCATVVPQPGQTFSFLVDLADQALYAAKHAGRNCIYPPINGNAADLLSSPPEHVGLA